jgi:glycerophosphoryl diester phosphodiesterase
MAAPVSVTRNGHRTFFKWHRGRRRGSDPVFTGARILEAMALGASVEVDLVVTGDKGFAVLHDLGLDRETTGAGPVAAASDAAIRALHLRANDGTPLADKVMLLGDLCALMAAGPVHPEALLQLDYKEDECVLDAAAIENFARAAQPVAPSLIVSSGSAVAVKLLTDAVPGLRSGYDPSDEAAFRAALAGNALQRFVDDAVAAAPAAELIYLHWQMVTLAADAGFDLIGAFHRYEKRIDCWTIQRVDAASLAVVERLLRLGVDQITTDDPEGLAAALG